MTEYTVDYCFQYKKWCVYVQMTASIRSIYQKCDNKGEAEKLAERLNKEDLK
jgi:hypothetical protein